MPDQDTMRNLMNLSTISSEQEKQLLQSPNLAIDAETGRPVDVTELQGQALEAIADDSPAELEEAVEVTEETQVELLHYTQDAPEEIDYAKDPRYLRIDNLPSRFIFYPWSQLFGRIMDIDDWVNLTRAVRRENITEFIDTFDATLSVSIRDLAYHDFTWYMYWQRMNSFPSNPLMLNWVSRYGNDNQTQVTKTNLIDTQIKMTTEEYLALQERGYRVPTVRDYEILMSGYLDNDQMTKYRIIQYLTGPEYPTKKQEIEKYVADCMSLYGKKSLTEIADIHNVREQLTFGITNQVELVDQNFDLESWKKQLTRGISILQTRQNPDQQLLTFFENQLAQIGVREGAGEEIQATPEMVNLVFNPWTFFPGVPE